ncbi:MAG: lysostaphin resistance A-like protein [Promethearchaeota archaeon]
MDLIYLYGTLVLVGIQGVFLYYSNKFEKNPTPLPRSAKPKIDLIETGILTLIVIIHLTLDNFKLYQNFNMYLSLGLNTIIFFLTPLLYTHYKDRWTFNDLGITSKVESWRFALLWFSLYVLIGSRNTFGVVVSWYQLLIFLYSNAFLEEFLFRAIIQSKLERALGQKKAIIYQGFIFMIIHIPVNAVQLSLNGDLFRFFSQFGLQLLNGIIFGVIFLKTRNIWMSIICHYLNNWLGAIITLFLLSF